MIARTEGERADIVPATRLLDGHLEFASETHYDTYTRPDGEDTPPYSDQDVSNYLTRESWCFLDFLNDAFCSLVSSSLIAIVHFRSLNVFVSINRFK